MSPPQVVLIAGASSEIGQATAELLLERGYRVFGASREPPGEGPAGLVTVPLDVNSDASVAECVRTVVEQADRIDVLVNLVSFVLEGAIEEVTVEEARTSFETNVFGMFRLVHAVLPIMRRQGGGRIVNVSALSGVVAVPFMGIYTATRFAVEGATEALWHEVRPHNVRVSLLEIMSPVKTRVFQRSVRSAGRSIDAYRAPRQRLVNFVRKSTEAGADPRLVARAFLRIIESTSPRIRYQVAPGARMLNVMRRTMPDTTLRRMLGRRMLGR